MWTSGSTVLTTSRYSLLQKHVTSALCAVVSTSTEDQEDRIGKAEDLVWKT